MMHPVKDYKQSRHLRPPAELLIRGLLFMPGAGTLVLEKPAL